ncbi:MAG: ABC transporter permease [Lachnospiraceae bacterium]|jgi:ribose transport system permease protein
MATTSKKKFNSSALLRRIIMPALLVLMMIFFSIMAPGTFFTWYNIKNMLGQSAYIIVAAVGLSFVMIGGGIDLSIGYQMSLVGVIAGILMVKVGLHMLPTILICLAIGVVLGLFNGIIVVKLKVFPLIITLSTSMIFQGISYIISGSQTNIGFSESFLFIGQGFIWKIPFCIIICAVIVVIAIFILEKTYFGRHIYAIGGNEEAAKLSGINSNRIRVILYGICGLCSAMASILIISRAAASASTIGPGTEFTALSGCILGGITLAGGEGKLSGMVVGALIITVLGNGMQLMYLGTYPQYIAKGIVLIVAMGFDLYQKNRRAVKKMITT